MAIPRVRQSADNELNSLPVFAAQIAFVFKKSDLISSEKAMSDTSRSLAFSEANVVNVSIPTS